MVNKFLEVQIAEAEYAVRKSRDAMGASTFSGRGRTQELLNKLNKLREQKPTECAKGHPLNASGKCVCDADRASLVLNDEQSLSESASQAVDRLLYMLGPDTDHDNYTFSIKRGNLRKVLLAFPAASPASVTPDAGERERALELALLCIAEGNLGDLPWQANYERIRTVVRNALTAASHTEGGKGGGL